MMNKSIGIRQERSQGMPELVIEIRFNNPQ